MCGFLFLQWLPMGDELVVTESEGLFCSCGLEVRLKTMKFADGTRERDGQFSLYMQKEVESGREGGVRFRTRRKDKPSRYS